MNKLTAGKYSGLKNIAITAFPKISKNETTGKINNKLSLSVNLGISQSVLNFWAFADNANDFNFNTSDHPGVEMIDNRI